MDPNEALKELREIVNKLNEKDNKYSWGEGRAISVDEQGFMIKFEGLDQWLSTGGFLPGAWQH